MKTATSRGLGAGVALLVCGCILPGLPGARIDLPAEAGFAVCGPYEAADTPCGGTVLLTHDDVVETGTIDVPNLRGLTDGTTVFPSERIALRLTDAALDRIRDQAASSSQFGVALCGFRGRSVLFDLDTLPVAISWMALVEREGRTLLVLDLGPQALVRARSGCV